MPCMCCCIAAPTVECCLDVVCRDSVRWDCSHYAYTWSGDSSSSRSLWVVVVEGAEEEKVGEGGGGMHAAACWLKL